MRRDVAIFMMVGLIILAGCSSSESASGNMGSVTTPDGDEVGESSLVRADDKVSLTFEACCAVPGNAYTAWWLIGDVTKSMSAVRTEHAAGFVAEIDEIVLEVEIELDNPLDGIRLVVLDHGPDTGDPRQLNSPGGGCPSTPCPVLFSSSHPAIEK